MMTKLHCGILMALVASMGALTAGCEDTPTNTGSTSSSSSSSSSSGEGGMGGSAGMGGGGKGGAGGAAGTGGMGGSAGAGGSGGSGGGMMALPDLDPNLMWHGQNREALDAHIDDVGQNSASYDPANKPVAIFDWDNTVIKNDIGDIMFFHQVKNDKIIQPPNKNWQRTSRYLTTEAATALSAACDGLAAAGMPLPTSTDAACADELVAVYTTAKTKAGATAFAGWNYRTMEPSYAWVAQLQAGYTTDELKGFAKTALEAALAEAEGATQMVGTTSVNAWLRLYGQIANLIDVMQKNGFDVWVISASSQPIVEAFAEKVNIAADHVVGIRTVKDAMGKHTYDLVGCGSVADGSGNGSGNPMGNTMITYIDGKRCWMNKVIYGVSGAAAEMTNADMAKRPVFGAGDSDTDISFLHDATKLKLVLNRNKKEIMCNGYGNYMGKWIVNPMFILPLPQLAAGYACSTTACKDAAGAGVPCKNEAGENIPDQMDTVF